MEQNVFPEHTQQSQNFKDYLAGLDVANFGEFVCAYKFSLAEINALVAAASQNGNPTHLRVYYGCEAGGTNHRLFYAVLDADDNVLQVQPLTGSAPSPAADGPGQEPAKCPPGCRSDAIIMSVLTGM